MALLEATDIHVVWTYDEPQRVFETVGFVVDFNNKVVRNKPRRLWRTYLAGMEICRRTKI